MEVEVVLLHSVNWDQKREQRLLVHLKKKILKPEVEAHRRMICL
jgi:hypothetical protein